MDRATSAATEGGVHPGAVSLSPVSWCARQQLSMHEWVAQGRRLGMAGRHVGWWIGDWLRYGNTAYGERYARASKITGYDPQTLMNMVYVASQVDVARRHASLSWSHHAEVAALTEDEQERWLARAQARSLSVRDLREEIRRERRQARPADAQVEQATEPASGDTLRCPECGHVLSLDAQGGVHAGQLAAQGGLHARELAGQLGHAA